MTQPTKRVLAHFAKQYDRMTHGRMERKLMSLRGQPKWRVAVAMLGVWVIQFRAGLRDGLPVARSARLAVLFVGYVYEQSVDRCR